MPEPTWLLLMVAMPFLCYYIVHYYYSYKEEEQFQSYSRANGCKSPYRAPSLPWGADRIWKILRFNGDFLDDFIFADFIDQDRWTYSRAGPLGEEQIWTCDPNNTKTLLSTKFKDYGNGPDRLNAFGPLMGYGILTTDGAVWEHFRGMLRPFFTKNKVGDLQRSEKHIQAFLRALPPTAKDGWTARMDLQPLFSRLAMDTYTDFLFNHSVNSQIAAVTDCRATKRNDAGVKALDFSEAFQLATQYIVYRIRVGRFYWVYNSKAFRDACAVCHQFADHYIAIALNSSEKAVLQSDNAESTFAGEKGDISKKSATKGVDSSKQPLIHQLITETKDPILLRSQLIQLLLAGRDTTSSILSFIFLELARHPSVFTSLRASVISVFGTAPEPDLLTLQKFLIFPPLMNLINETVRLYPILPINNRTCISSAHSILPTGGGPDGSTPIAVRKGTVVNYSDYVMFRRPDIWGDDAGSWRPDRHDGRKRGWEFTPFGAGPKICIGRKSPSHPDFVKQLDPSLRTIMIEDPLSFLATCETGNVSKSRL
ncbi:hypothetical protein MMC06_001951 [Schaereria dolodes]|nr:hypothetical protein [Schaereria dolodes]